jgi:diguanylate cyclase (GGDEF)-like protein
MSKPNSEFIQINDEAKAFPSSSRKIDEALLSLVYKQAKIGFVASIICAAILLVGLHRDTGNLPLYLWFGFSVTVTVLRSLLIQMYDRHPAPQHRYKFWRNLFIFGATMAGVTWGVVGAGLLPDYAPDQQMLIVLVLAGICAGAVPVIAGITYASIGFLALTLAPLFIRLLFVKGEITLVFDTTLLAYLVYLISLTYKTNSILRNSIALQFENSALLANLSEAKTALETTNIKLEQAATHDPLTNAANRSLFNTNFAKAITRAKRNNTMLALLFIDLDNFKEVNDIYGHHAGDQLLLGVIRHLTEVCKNNHDNIFRLGGDEFTVIIEDFKNVSEVADISSRLCDAIAKPVGVGDRKVKVSASVGISIFPLDGEEPERLLQNADRSMYSVKQKGGNNFLFNVDMLV